MSYEKVILDLESNNLMHPMLDYTQKPLRFNPEFTVWCLSLRCVDTNESKLLVRPDLLANIDKYITTVEQEIALSKIPMFPLTKEQMEIDLKNCEELIAHNGIKFDFPVLKVMDLLDYNIGYPYLESLDNTFDSTTSVFKNTSQITDTMIWSKLLNADRMGGHSLKNFGSSGTNKKIDFHDFENFSAEMLIYCITPDMRLLDDNLTWRPASSFKVGETILGFDEENQNNRSGRRYKNSTIEIITPDKQEVFEVKLRSGKILKVTKEHRFLTCVDSSNGYTNYNWTMTKDLVFGRKNNSKLPCLLPVKEKLETYDSGWLGGIFDGEGCIGNGKSRPPTLSVAQRPGIVLDNIETILKDNSINFSKRYVNKINDCHSLKILDGLPSVYNTLSLFRPERLISKLDYDTFGKLELKGIGFKDEVISVTSIGFQDILKIQTSTGTFMCEGYPMHNCDQDTSVNRDAYLELMQEKGSYEKWETPYLMEAKLADMSLNQELFGFAYDLELSERCKVELDILLKERYDEVTPQLPNRPLNKGEQKFFTPPKTKFSASANRISAAMTRFIDKVGGEYNPISNEYTVDGIAYDLYSEECVKKSLSADIKDLDHLKSYLISLGWIPSQWNIRDLTKDSKKKPLTKEKFLDTLDRYIDNTYNGFFKESRLRELEFHPETSEKALREYFVNKYNSDRKASKSPLRVPTSPPLKVGTSKELCPNLESMKDELPFIRAVTEFFTYQHRRNSISGNVDEESGESNSGFESYLRTDGRVATPVDTLATNTSRMAHREINI